MSINIMKSRRYRSGLKMVQFGYCCTWPQAFCVARYQFGHLHSDFVLPLKPAQELQLCLLKIFNHIYAVSEPKPPTPFLPIGKKAEPGNFYE